MQVSLEQSEFWKMYYNTIPGHKNLLFFFWNYTHYIYLYLVQ